MAIPFVVFWILLFLARDDLGYRGIVAAIAVWIGLLVGFMAAGVSPYLFVGAQALLDVILMLVAFGEDVTIR